LLILEEEGRFLNLFNQRWSTISGRNEKYAQLYEPISVMSRLLY